ncbi:hypothetical protein Zmor_025898 [Zophobas morio]|uniref:Retinol dehydrogenase 11 n=1 Tax=Zophobas morio TaxID=2755281 RepID=A0AA38HSC0_9CUCU|nr:hypothetical protein Zmor_025898 [Zophobas morio]
MDLLLITVFILAAIVAALKIYTKLTLGTCKSQVCLVGKTAIVTGANCGIGYETAFDFAKRGAKVILACRNISKAQEARRKIIEETHNHKIFVRVVDLASFDSVRGFAKEINKTEDRLDILVNNAGAIGLEHKRTVDGRPLLMQVNYFSSFLLTNLLLNLLKKSGPSRIVNVSSLNASMGSKLDVNNIDNFVPRFNDDYNHSKLCNVLFTIELAKKLQGTSVTTYSLHPGFVETEILHNFHGVLKALYMIIVKLFSMTCEEGAQTNIYCSVAKGIEDYSGEHFDSCKKVKRYKTAADPELAKKLWKKTEELVGLKPEENPF